MNDLNRRITIIKHKIDKAIRLSTRWINPIRPFGSENGLKFNPPIALEKLIEIEDKYEIKFPDEYRAFITKIANGSSGSHHGLGSLERSLKFSVPFDSQGQVCYDFLKIPFNHTSHCYPNEHPYINELSDKCDRGEITEEEFDLAYDPFYDYLSAGTMIGRSFSRVSISNIFFIFN